MSESEEETVPPFEKWYEVRNGPKKKSGLVIAIWHQTAENHELAFGIMNLEYPPEREDDKRTYGRSDVGVISQTLVKEISEAEYSVHTEIADIPEIISDGTLHYLGNFKWFHTDGVNMGHMHEHWEDIMCTGDVYTKVVLSAWDGDTSRAQNTAVTVVTQ